MQWGAVGCSGVQWDAVGCSLILTVFLRQADIDGLDSGQAKPAARKTPPASAGAPASPGFPYFTAGLGGYAIGLATTFVANYVTRQGQPALVYIVPSLLIAATATAASRG